MNVRHPEGVLHSFSIKNISYDKMDLRLFLFSCGNMITILYKLHNVEIRDAAKRKFMNI